MGRYVLSRLAQAVFVVFAISIAAFVVVHLVPGDPARLLAGPRAGPGAVDELRHQLGLDRPLLSQYWDFISGAARGNFGFSITQHAPVGELVSARIGASLLLIAYTLVIALLITVPLAVVASTHRNRVADHVIRVFSTVTFAMPTFWLGLLLVLLFSLRLKLLPSSGYGDTFLDHLRSLTLPAVAVGLSVAPVLLRTLRSSMIETLSAEFVDATRARGLAERRVLYRHVLRNSLISTVTLLGIFVGVLLSGTVAVENVFAIPGLGSLLVTAVNARDFPTIEALVLVFGVAVVVVNLVTDLLYVALDPRVRL